MKPILIPAPQVRLILGVTRKELQRLVRDKHLPPPVKTAEKRYAFNRIAVERFIELTASTT